jgi:hypothetical protein
MVLRTEDAEERSGLLEQLLADERNRAFELNEAGLQRRDVLANPPPLKTIQAMFFITGACAQANALYSPNRAPIGASQWKLFVVRLLHSARVLSPFIQKTVEGGSWL